MGPPDAADAQHEARTAVPSTTDPLNAPAATPATITTKTAERHELSPRCICPAEVRRLAGFERGALAAASSAPGRPAWRLAQVKRAASVTEHPP